MGYLNQRGNIPRLVGPEKHESQLFHIEDYRSVKQALDSNNTTMRISALQAMMYIIAVNPFEQHHVRANYGLNAVLHSLGQGDITPGSMTSDRTLDGKIKKVKLRDVTIEEAFDVAKYFRMPYARSAFRGALLNSEVYVSEYSKPLLDTAMRQTVDHESQAWIAGMFMGKDELNILAGAVLVSDTSTPYGQSMTLSV